MSAPPAYDNPTCSEETAAPAYPTLERDLPILLPLSHPDNPLNVMFDQEGNNNTSRKTTITVQPIASICTSSEVDEEQETCCEKFKFWGCFTCLVFAYVCSAVK